MIWAPPSSEARLHPLEPPGQREKNQSPRTLINITQLLMPQHRWQAEPQEIYSSQWSLLQL